MPRVTYSNTNFTAGELSERLYGRVDIQRYQNGARSIVNAWPVIHGGALRRHGTLYVAETKDSTKRSRLIAFVFNLSQTYVLELGHLYMRVYKDSAQVLSAPSTPYEIATPYTEAMLADINFVQGADTIILAHPSVHPKRLRRFGDTLWDLGDVPFEPAPFDERGLTPATTCTLSAASVGSGRTFTAGASTYLASDVGRKITSGAGIADITGYTSATVVTATITTAFAGTSLASGGWKIGDSPQTTCTPSVTGPVGAACTLTLAADGWRSADVGKFVEMNGGLVEITGHTSATVVSGTVSRVLSSTTAAPANAWSLRDAVWSSTLGYPRAVTLYQQRLVFAGSETYPGWVWGSKTGLLFDFTLGVNDDEAFAFEIAAGEVNTIQHLVSRDALIAITSRSEYTMQGGVERPLAPTNVQVKQRSTYGTGAVRPVTVRDETLFVQRAGRKLRALKYDVETGGYIAPDIAVLAEHITDGGVTEMAYQQEYDSLLWCVRADGVLLTCSLDRDQDIVGWARQITGGEFESVAVIPIEGRDQVWAVVKRTIDGSDVRYVEVFSPAVLADCAITGTSGPGAATWSGLDHLEGEAVQCVADGVFMGEFTVAAGEITIPRTANDVVIGLPYTSRLEPLPPEVPGVESGQGNAVSACAVTVRFLDTVSCKMNGDPLAFRHYDETLLDQPIEPYTGTITESKLGWATGEDDLVLTQDEPLAWHVLSITRKITVNS